MDHDNEAPRRFRNIGFAATWAAAITLICVIVGQTAQKYALDSSTNAPIVASTEAAKTSRPQFNVIDYATTGAIKGQTIVIGPCVNEKPGP